MTGVSFEEYLTLLDFTNRLGELNVAGPYSARKTIKLLNTMTPPYNWFLPGEMSDIDINRPQYCEMVDIFESARNGNFHKPYNDRATMAEAPGELPQDGVNAGSSPEYNDHGSALKEYIQNGLIGSRELLHYLYSHKKPAASETYNDHVVNILVLYMLAYSLSLGSDNGVRHSDVLDSILMCTHCDL